MNKDSTSETFHDPDEYPELAQADFDRETYRVNRQPVPHKKRITILLDASLVDHFKALAGERGYQTLINETLRHAVEQEDLEARLRRVIREEMARYSASDSES